MTDHTFSALSPAAPADDIHAYQPPMSTQFQSQVPAQPVVPTPVQAAPAPAPAEADKAPNSESLESQNIFALLGVEDGVEADKEAFLDELQDVIWQDFLAHDLQLLLTQEELAQVKTIQSQNADMAKQQEAIVAFLEKLIPDLEDIMLEKALELKREMVKERVEGLRSYLAGKPDQLAQLESAERLISQDKWQQATQVLNTLQ